MAVRKRGKALIRAVVALPEEEEEARILVVQAGWALTQVDLRSENTAMGRVTKAMRSGIIRVDMDAETGKSTKPTFHRTMLERHRQARMSAGRLFPLTNRRQAAVDGENRQPRHGRKGRVGVPAMRSRSHGRHRALYILPTIKTPIRIGEMQVLR